MSAPVRYRLLVTHVSGPSRPGAPAISEPREVPCRYVRVPACCPDCRGRPRTSPVVPFGYSASAIIEHDESCPAVHALLRRHGVQP